MRLLFLCQSSPLKEGGAETRTREVAYRLARAGHDVTVLCGRTSPDDPPEQRVKGVRFLVRAVLPRVLLRRFPYPHYLPLAAANLFLMFHVVALLRKEHFDLIREDIAPFPPSFLLALVRLGTPRIAVLHMQPESLSGWVRYYGLVYGVAGAVMGALLRKRVLRYDQFISAAQWFAHNLEHYPALAGRVHCVPNGVDIKRFSVRNGGVPTAARLLCVGRLAQTKGHRFLLEAVAMLKDDFPELRLALVGNGDEREALEALAGALGIADRTGFLVPVAHDEMPALYLRHDIFVMPSLWEGQPVSLIEAMACGLPVVASRIQGVVELADDECATLVAPADAAALAVALRGVLCDPALAARKAATARERASGYDWSVTAAGELAAACLQGAAATESKGRHQP